MAILKNKSAIITGSTGGIGLGIAKALAASGCNIMLDGLDNGADANVQNLKKEISSTYGVRCEYSCADISKPEEVSRMVAETKSAFGKVDILVNNAGVQFTAPVEEFPIEKWNQIISINLSASFYSIREVLPGMQANGFGRIINIASAHGLVASKTKAAYVAAKHGLLGLTKVVALENAERNITCNAICPGWVLTPMVQKQIEDKAAAEGISIDQAKNNLLGEKQPSKRFVTVEELGALAVFLSSDAAQGMTGSTIAMDGGWTAQ
jgi:3-hydroxybutyrate dehydrogenase